MHDSCTLASLQMSIAGPLFSFSVQEISLFMIQIGFSAKNGTNKSNHTNGLKKQ